MTDQDKLTDGDRKMYGDLAKRIAVAYISWHTGLKSMDTAYRMYAGKIDPLDRWIRLAKLISEGADQEWKGDEQGANKTPERTR
jgi:hypothetical protein